MRTGKELDSLLAEFKTEAGENLWGYNILRRAPQALGAQILVISGFHRICPRSPEI